MTRKKTTGRLRDIPASRHDDPWTSSHAEDEITEDGSRGTMVEVALELVKRNPGKSANELEYIGGFRDGQLRKRLNDLLKLGCVKKAEVHDSSVTGKPNQTWEYVKKIPSFALPRLSKPPAARIVLKDLLEVLLTVWQRLRPGKVRRVLAYVRYRAGRAMPVDVERVVKMLEEDDAVS
jgi:hypothetical protein